MLARVFGMVKNYCHAAGGHQTQNSVGSKAEKPVIEEQRVESRKNIKNRMTSSLCGDQMPCMRVPGPFDEDNEEEKQMSCHLGVGCWANRGNRTCRHFSSLHHALCHEKAARFVGLAMCMSNSQFPLFIPPSFDNPDLSSRRPCQSVSLSEILPAFENTSNSLEERTKNAPLR